MKQKNFYQWATAVFNKYKGTIPVLFLLTFVAVEPAFAGLAKGKSTFEEIKVWVYSMLGVGVFIYVMYHIIMAMAGKMQWSDVFIAVGYSALAGAAVVLTTWAWGIWGTAG